MKYIADFSDWQAGIDFDSLYNHFHGVIVKISEGLTEQDCWRGYIEQAQAKGMQWGVYCYSHAMSVDDARAEARMVIDLIQSTYGRPTLGIWYDLEAPETVGLDNDTLTDIASAFISTCNAANLSAGIYAPLWIIQDKINTGDLAAYVPYWVAAYSAASNPLAGSGLRVQGWQYRDDYPVGDHHVDASEWYV